MISRRQALMMAGVLAAVGGSVALAYWLSPSEPDAGAFSLAILDEGETGIAAGETLTGTLRLTYGDTHRALVIETTGLELVMPTATVALQPLPPGAKQATQEIDLLLRVPAEAPAGPLHGQVTAKAGRRILAAVPLVVSVTETRGLHVVVEPLAPAAIPGVPVNFLIRLGNPAKEPTVVNVSLEGAEGTVTPDRVPIPAGGESLVHVQAASPTSGFAASVRLTWGAEARRVPLRLPPAHEGLDAHPLAAQVHASPTDVVSIPVVVASTANVTASLSVDGGRVVPGRVAFPGVHGVFVELEAPQPGAHRIRLSTVSGSVEFPVTVKPVAGVPVEEGDRVGVAYVGRLADGVVFDTSLPTIAFGPFPKAETFRARSPLDYQSLQVQIGPGQTIEGFWRAMPGLAAQQSRTVTIEPEQAYGPAWTGQERAALTITMNRTQVSPLDMPTMPRAALERPGSGIDLDEVGVGGRFNFTTPQGLEMRLIVRHLDNQTVRVRLDLAPGDAVAVIPQWPGSTVVTAVENGSARLVTTPPAEAWRQPFTFFDAALAPHATSWANATIVTGISEELIVFRVIPPAPGTEYAIARPGQPSVAYRIVAVDDDEATVEQRSQHPLAGERLVFDLTRVR